MSLNISEPLLLVHVDEDKRKLHCISMGIKRCICPCELGTKSTYGGSNLQLSMYKLHKRSAIVFVFYVNEIHTCATVKDHFEDKIFKILCII